jgi:hypothetical protein
MINLSLLFIQEQAILLCRPLRSGISFIVPGSICGSDAGIQKEELCAKRIISGKYDPRVPMSVAEFLTLGGSQTTRLESSAGSCKPQPHRPLLYNPGY